MAKLVHAAPGSDEHPLETLQAPKDGDRHPCGALYAVWTHWSYELRFVTCEACRAAVKERDDRP